jgi:deoxyhypusine monooxygenase
MSIAPVSSAAAAATSALAAMSVKEVKETAIPARVRAHSHSSSHHHGEEEEEEIFFEIPEFALLAEVLLDESAPIAKRMRTAFLLKQLGDTPSIELLAKGLRSPSVLMAHECGYVLGQLQNKIAIPMLESVLRDTSVNPIVRHECAEALGAIGDATAIPLLKEFSTDASEEVRETCLIALEKLAWNAANPGVTYASKYASVDPAPRTDDAEDSIDTLQKRLMDSTKTHFERYRAMFALRDRDSESAVVALTSGFSDPSAVFRHEVAYVMGQMAHPAAIISLKQMLSNEGEHAMVRHEAAEALGAIAADGITPYLQTYQQSDKDRIVRESCDVALDLADYWTNDEVSTAVNPNK